MCRRLISQRIDARQSLLMKLNETLPQVDRKENSFDVSSATPYCVPFQMPVSSFNIEGPTDDHTRRQQIQVNYYDPNPLLGLKRHQLVLLKGEKKI